MTYMKSGQPFLYDDTTGDIVGVRDADGGDAYFAKTSGTPRATLMPPRLVLAQWAVPVILSPNGTVAAGGVVTLGTALPVIYAGGAWIRLPANAIVGGAAGLYWCVFTSTTQGQVYTAFNAASSEFIPELPTGTLVAAVGSNSAYTQTTGADITLANVSLGAGVLGNNGGLFIEPYLAQPNNANNKIWKTKIGSTQLSSNTNTTAVADARSVLFRNAGSPSLNFASGFMGQTQGGSSYPYARTAIDTSVSQSILITGQLATATDYLCLDAASLSLVL